VINSSIHRKDVEKNGDRKRANHPLEDVLKIWQSATGRWRKNDDCP
jgi:hypothetical protein